jgi:hypothetical protein
MAMEVRGTWERDRSRWTIMIDGERYKRTANQLGCKEATKEGTAKAWMAYVESVEASLKPAPSIKQLRVAAIQKTLTQAPPEETDELKQAIINIESGEYDPRLALVDEPTIWRNIDLLRKAENQCFMES